MQQRDYEGAIDVWRQAIALQGGNAGPHLRLAEALAAAKRTDEAVTEYVTAVSLNAGADVHRRLAELYQTMGRTTEANRERATHLEWRLQELRRRADGGSFGF
jgi:tetratricopeptide (TPR) repeat protein